MEVMPINKFLLPRFFCCLFRLGIVLFMAGWSGAALGAGADQVGADQATQSQALASDKANKPEDPQWESLLSLIAPYKQLDIFEGNWRFDNIEHFDETDLVFSLANERAGQKLYVWLTDINSPGTALGTSRNFKILCLVRNGKPLNESQKKIAGKIVELIQKNDSGEMNWRLKKIPRYSRGRVVQIPSDPGNEPPRRLNVSIFRVVFFSLLLILAIGIFYRIFVRIRASRRNASKT